MRIKPYSKEIEVQMLKVYKSLSERDRRHYAAIEATKLVPLLLSSIKNKIYFTLKLQAYLNGSNHRL